MQWLIKFLHKRLKQEEDIAAYHGSIAAAGRKYAESARMARERIPQLKVGLKLITDYSKINAVPKPKVQPTADNQLTIF